MAKFSVDTKGIDKLIEGVRKAKEIVDPKNLKPRIAELIKATYQELVKETPVGDEGSPNWHEDSEFFTDKKHLKEHWQYKVEIKFSVVSSSIFLDKAGLDALVDLLEVGSAAHIITPKQPGGTLVFFVNEGGSYRKVFTSVVSHPGFAANRFVDRVEEKHRKRAKILSDKITADFNNAIKRV